jgi:hypothetical protein
MAAPAKFHLASGGRKVLNECWELSEIGGGRSLGLREVRFSCEDALMSLSEAFRASNIPLEELDIRNVSALFAVFAARRCMPNFTKAYPDDESLLRAIEAVENHVAGPRRAGNKSMLRRALPAVKTAWRKASAAAKSATTPEAESEALSALDASEATGYALSVLLEKSIGAAAASAASSAGESAWSMAMAATHAARLEPQGKQDVWLQIIHAESDLQKMELQRQIMEWTATHRARPFVKERRQGE